MDDAKESGTTMENQSSRPDAAPLPHPVSTSAPGPSGQPARTNDRSIFFVGQPRFQPAVAAPVKALFQQGSTYGANPGLHAFEVRVVAKF